MSKPTATQYRRNPTTTFVDVAREHSRRFRLRPAIACGAERKSYAQLYEDAELLASALRRRGIAEGGRIAWLAQNCHRLLELVLACDLLGATVFPLNWRSSVGELKALLDDVEPDLIIWQDTELGPKVRAARAAASTTDAWLCVDHGCEWQRFLDAGAARISSDTPDPYAERSPLAIFTSAFSGRPAAALLASEALVAQAILMGQARDIDHTSVTATVGPMFHLGVWLALLPTFVAGGVNVIVRRVDPVQLCATIERERCTHAYLVAATQEQLVAANQDGSFDLRSLRSSGGSAEWRAMVSPDRSPWAVRPGVYGQTETTGVVAFKMIGPPSLGNAGWTSPLVELRIVAEDGSDVPDGEVGEIVVRGSVVMRGYFRRPDRNRTEMRDGWRYTNDLGRREADGSLTFVGPKGRMIKSGLENIYAIEVEAALSKHAAVRECAVIGVPDEHWAQRVKAVVAVHRDVSAESLIAHCRTLVAGYKVPRLVEFVDSLPRTSAGAIDYAAVDAEHGGGGYPGVGEDG